MAVTTKEKKAAAIKHILETVFGLPPGNTIELAFKANDILSPYDIVSTPADDIELLTFTKDGTDQPQHLSRGHIGKIQAFNAFVRFQQFNGKPIKDDDWVKLTACDCDMFRSGPDYERCQLSGPPNPTSPKAVDPVREFKKGIRRDPNAFMILKQDSSYDAWNRNTVSQARAQGVEDVLNSKCKPTNTQEKDLFNKKQKCMCAVFEKTI